MDTTAARAAAAALHGRRLLAHVPTPRTSQDGGGRTAAPEPGATGGAPGHRRHDRYGRHGRDVAGLLDGTPVGLGAILAAAVVELTAPQASSST